ncbi:MAG TPA: transposase [Syntrophales bacterium]|nr:transposase [Syntrophales bacterium]HRT61109.1 transposase [Syntrophales bacterium]
MCGTRPTGATRRNSFQDLPETVADICSGFSKRFDLCVLNYMVTSNHVHLLVRDNGGRDVIPNSIQLIAGRTGQEFNQRKNRKGAYWEDRYHATAVETDSHLIPCLLYIDLNMVRAGVVRHPSEWPFGGYSEIQRPRERYALVDYRGLRDLLTFKEMPDLADAYRGWIEEAIGAGGRLRDGKWSESVAVGSESFVRMTREKPGVKAKGREVVDADGSYVLRESPASYGSISGHEHDVPSPENTYFRHDNL